MKECIEFIYNNNYDIVGICETKINDSYKLKISGYSVYTANRNNRGGGVAIIVKKSIEHSFFDKNITFENLEMVGINIYSGGNPLSICQVYKPPNRVLSNTDLENLFCKQNMIVMGDLNCKRKEWRCPTNNTSGSVLLEFCLSKGVIISAPENNTNFPTIGRPSVIDLFLFKGNFNHSLPVTRCKLSSDHNPVEICVFYNFKTVNTVKIFDYSKANWIKFRRYVNDNINLIFHLQTKEGVESKTNELIGIISRAIENSIPVKKENFQGHCLPAHIKLLIKIKNKVRKLYQKKANEHYKFLLKKLAKLVTFSLRNFHSQRFQNFIKNLNLNDGSFWKYTKKFTKKSEFAPTLYDDNGSIYKTDNEKADAFALHFSKISNSCNDLGSKTFTAKVDKTVKEYLKTPLDLNSIRLTTYIEVKNTIRSLKSNKATGHDLISSKILKNLPRKALVFLIKIINGIFCTGHFPSAWKIAKVIPVPKAGKDPTKLTNYRPISLLSHLSKVVELIIKRRILSFLQENEILVNEQFGFRPGHSTVDQLARLVNQITENFNKKLHTGAMLLDAEKAFDTVWIMGLIYKMIMLKFPQYIVFLISSYLSERELFVFLNGINSLMHKLLAGVPQGSVLGPILFLIFINDAPKIKGVDDSIFADDKLMSTASFRLSAIIKRLQQAFKANKRFYHKWKIKLNENKTELILFTRRRPLFIDFKLGNQTIKWSDHVKYLGVMLDSKLNFSKHINYVRSKAIATLIKLYPILNQRSFFSTENKMLLYKVIVRPALTYASPIWSITCKSNFEKLQVTQNKFLRLIGKYRKWSLITRMHDELKIERIQEYIIRMTKNFFLRIENHVNKLVLNVKYDTSIKYKHKRIMDALK